MMRMRKNLTICLMCVCLAAGVGCKKGADNSRKQPEPARQAISMEQTAPAPAEQPAASEVVVVEEAAPEPVVVTPTPQVPAETQPPASEPVTEKEATGAPSTGEQQPPSDMPAAPAEGPPVPPEKAVSGTAAPGETAGDEETNVATMPEPEMEAAAETVDDTVMEADGDTADIPAEDVLAEPEIVINLEEEPSAEETAETAAEEEALALFSPFTPLFQKDAKEEDMLIEQQDSQRKRAFLTPLERISLGQLQLSGIIRASSGNRAIVTDATGKGYVVKKGTYIGLNSGQVEEIVDDRVVVVEMIGGRRAVTELKLQKPAGE